MDGRLFYDVGPRVRRSPVIFPPEVTINDVGPEPNRDHQQDALFDPAEAGVLDLSDDPRTRGLTNQCPQECTLHSQHVYVLCYGREVRVADSDVDGDGDEALVSHYVGWTGAKHPPKNRIATHGNRSRRHVVALFPGTLENEDRTRETRICPRCGRSLWYYRRRPGSLFEIGDEVRVGRSARYRVVDVTKKGASLRRVHPDGALGDPVEGHQLPRGALRLGWRDPDGYLACVADWQEALVAHATSGRSTTDRLPQEIRAFDQLQTVIARRQDAGEQIHSIWRL